MAILFLVLAVNSQYTATGHTSLPQTQPQGGFLLAQLEMGHQQGLKAVEEILKGI